MKSKYKYYICPLLCALLLGFSAQSASPSFDVNIKGQELVNDKEFLAEFLHVLVLETQYDYITIYGHLSKGYLKYNLSPLIESATDFEKHMKRSMQHSKTFQRIIEFKVIRKYKYSITVSYQEDRKGDKFNEIEKYYFVKENNSWKYDGSDLMKRRITRHDKFGVRRD